MAPVDMQNSKLIVTAGEPSEARAEVAGSMSDPCHELRVAVTPADSTGHDQPRGVLGGGHEHGVHHGDRAVQRHDPIGKLRERTFYGESE